MGKRMLILGEDFMERESPSASFVANISDSNFKSFLQEQFRAVNGNVCKYVLFVSTLSVLHGRKVDSTLELAARDECKQRH